MQSLGLGGLRIEHAVEKHRPEGYQVPDFLSGISADGYASSEGDLTGVYHSQFGPNRHRFSLLFLLRYVVGG